MTWDTSEPFIPTEEALEEASAKARQLNAWFAQCFSTEAGKRVLAYLERNTLEKPSFFPGQDVNYGIWREGQNNIVREITNRITKGKNNE